MGMCEGFQVPGILEVTPCHPDISCCDKCSQADLLYNSFSVTSSLQPSSPFPSPHSSSLPLSLSPFLPKYIPKCQGFFSPTFPPASVFVSPLHPPLPLSLLLCSSWPAVDSLSQRISAEDSFHITEKLGCCLLDFPRIPRSSCFSHLVHYFPNYPFPPSSMVKPLQRLFISSAGGL